MTRVSRVGSLGVLLALAACGGDQGLLDVRSDTGSDAVAADRTTVTDTGVPADVAAMDAAMNGDSAPDAQSADSGQDSAQDSAAMDSTVMDGAARDAVADSRPDAAADAAADAVIDARADAVADAAPDAVADAGADVALDVRADGGADAASDAGATGRCVPTVDGVIGADWTASAVVANNTVATTWGSANQLRSIRLCYDSTYLYMGVDGTSEAINAMVAYIDRDFGTSVTGVRDFSTLTDNTGALDNRISGAFTINVPNFGAEAAWGTNGPQDLMDTALVDTAGLRLIAPVAGGADRRADFAWVTGAQQRCAGATDATRACEVRIAWTALFEGPRPATARIAMFVRINNNDGTMSSNQTLPEDNAAAPRSVSRVLDLTVN